MNWNQLFRAGLAAAAVALCVGAQAASYGVTATVSPDKHNLGKSDDVIVNVTITNTSSSPQYVLKWHTPFAGEIDGVAVHDDLAHARAGFETLDAHWDLLIEWRPCLAQHFALRHPGSAQV